MLEAANFKPPPRCCTPGLPGDWWCPNGCTVYCSFRKELRHKYYLQIVHSCRGTVLGQNPYLYPLFPPQNHQLLSTWQWEAVSRAVFPPERAPFTVRSLFSSECLLRLTCLHLHFSQLNWMGGWIGVIVISNHTKRPRVLLSVENTLSMIRWFAGGQLAHGMNAC